MRKIDGEEKSATNNRSWLWCSLRSAMSQAQNQRTSKRPRMSGFKATQCGVETMVGVARFTPTFKPFDLPRHFEKVGWK